MLDTNAHLDEARHGMDATRYVQLSPPACSRSNHSVRFHLLGASPARARVSIVRLDGGQAPQVALTGFR